MNYNRPGRAREERGKGIGAESMQLLKIQLHGLVCLTDKITHGAIKGIYKNESTIVVKRA